MTVMSRRLPVLALGGLVAVLAILVAVPSPSNVHVGGGRQHLTRVHLSPSPSPSPTAPPEPPVTVTSASRPGVAQAPHSGDLLDVGGTFWWYGDSYSCGFVYGKPSPYCGVVAYHSTDLVHWNGPVQMFNPGAYWQQLCMETAGELNNGCFRPKVQRDPATGIFVMWLNVPGGYRVLASLNPGGPFTLVGSPNLFDAGVPDYQGKVGAGIGDGDESLFVDPTDGAMYVVYDRSGRLVVERLLADGYQGSGVLTSVIDFPEVGPWYGAEAPTIFLHAGTYFMTFSLPRCPYCTAATGLMQATSPLGPWYYVGELSGDSCGGQPNSVDALPGGVDIYSSDLWQQPHGWPNVNEGTALQHWEPLAWLPSGLPAPLSCPASFSLALPAS